MRIRGPAHCNAVVRMGRRRPRVSDNGYRQMYNMDFAAAHKTFESWQAVHPDDPIGAASNAAAYLFSEFERLRILDIDLFTESRRLDDLGKLKPDPKIKLAFEDELAKATQIASKILAESPEDRERSFRKASHGWAEGRLCRAYRKAKDRRPGIAQIV